LNCPFPLFSIPSGTLTAVQEKKTIQGPQPEKQLSEILEKVNLKKAKSIEEMLLLYLPFWKITLSTGEVIWIDAVQGSVAKSTIKKKIHHLPRIYRKLVLSLTLITLFTVSIQISPFLLRLLFQIGGVGLLFFFLRKEMKHAP
jgi:hypothetical protein